MAGKDTRGHLREPLRLRVAAGDSQEHQHQQTQAEPVGDRQDCSGRLGRACCTAAATTTAAAACCCDSAVLALVKEYGSAALAFVSDVKASCSRTTTKKTVATAPAAAAAAAIPGEVKDATRFAQKTDHFLLELQPADAGRLHPPNTALQEREDDRQPGLHLVALGEGEQEGHPLESQRLEGQPEVGFRVRIPVEQDANQLQQFLAALRLAVPAALGVLQRALERRVAGAQHTHEATLLRRCPQAQGPAGGAIRLAFVR